jgi:hypothetical protein
VTVRLVCGCRLWVRAVSHRVLSSDNHSIEPNQVGAEVDPTAVRGETCDRVVVTPEECYPSSHERYEVP